jgi:hypothetical protein
MTDISVLNFNSKSNLRYNCLYCSKTYIKKDTLNRHTILCSFNSKKIGDKELCRTDIPPISDLYSIIVDLSLKYDKLQADYDKLSNWVQQKKRKINIIDWLNEKCRPMISHDKWLDEIILTRKHLNYVFNYDFVDGIIYILQELLVIGDNIHNTIKAFDYKEGILYVYDRINEEDLNWHIMTGEEFQKMVRCISLNIMGQFKIWQDENMDKMEDDAFSRTYIINFKKVMGNTDYNSQYNKIRNKLYKYLKINLKNVMYEFD